MTTKGLSIKNQKENGNGQSLLSKSRPRIVYKVNQVDYDVNPTQLYRAIERKDWESCLEHLEKTPMDAATWVCRNESDGKLRWRLLPIHAAVIFKAPENIIERLIIAYPKGPKESDDEDMLPLHLAFRNGSSDKVLYHLLNAYPEGIEHKDRKGRIPLKLHTQNETTYDDIVPRITSLPLKKNISSGFERYVSIAVARERKTFKAELEVHFAETLKELRKEHEFEISTLMETNEKELAKAELKRKDLEKKMDASRSAAVGLMGKYQTKCKEGQSAKEKILESNEELERLTAEKDKELERLHGQNVTLNKINGELKTKAEKLCETNYTQKAQIVESKEKLDQAEENIMAMEKKMAEIRKASEKILMEYRQKCESEENAKKEMIEMSHWKSQFKKEEESNEFLKSKIANLVSQQEEANMRSILLQSEVKRKTEHNQVIESQLMEAKKHIQMLSGQLEKFAWGQDKLLQTEREEDISFETDERPMLLSGFADQLELSQGRSQFERDLAVTSAVRRNESVDRWLQAV